jgi:hypothetical protein
MRSTAGTAKRANEATESAAKHPDRANEPTFSAVERMAMIGGIASSAGRTESGANRRNKATTIGLEGIAAMGGIVPASGGKVGVDRAGRLSAHTGWAGSGHLCPPALPHRMAMLEERARGQKATEGGMVRQDSGRRSGSDRSSGIRTVAITSARTSVRSGSSPGAGHRAGEADPGEGLLYPVHHPAAPAQKPDCTPNFEVSGCGPAKGCRMRGSRPHQRR